MLNTQSTEYFTNSRYELKLPNLRQTFFVKNIIHNQSARCTNYKTQRSLSKTFTNNKTIQSNLLHQAKQNNFNHKKTLEKTNSLERLPVRRSYGSLNSNYNNNVNFNNRCSMKDNMICSDVLIKNDHIRQQDLHRQHMQKQYKSNQLKRQPVNVNNYREYLKTEEIIDAYYFVGQQRNNAQQRLQEKKQTVKRVKSLSVSKSNQVAMNFRKTQKEQNKCVQQIKKIKQKYSNLIVPSLMGTKKVTSTQSGIRLQNKIQKSLIDTHDNSFDHSTQNLKKFIKKCKSNEDFMQKQRVKVIKQAFIHNWAQGNNKEEQKYKSIHPCKYTQKLNVEKKTKRQKSEIVQRQQKYGKTANRMNQLMMTGSDSFKKIASIKEYQLKFDQIAKNNIKSCIIDKKG